MAEVIVVVEAKADAEMATRLAERVLLDTVDWLDPELLPYCIQWRGLAENTPYSLWSGDLNKREKLDQIAQTLGLKKMPKTLGHSPDGPLQDYGAAARKAITLTRLLQDQRPEIQGVLLVIDLDIKSADRKVGLEQVRQEDSQQAAPLQIILGVANPKREAWVLNGFIPANKQEEEILETLKKELQFDPCVDAHRLRAPRIDPDQSRNIKKVLARLTQGSQNREQQCWEETSLDRLKEQGQNTGLTDYLGEVSQYLPKILVPSP